MHTSLHEQKKPLCLKSFSSQNDLTCLECNCRLNHKT
uniref:Uncharacterized protein n=1 Tax=Anguilla anguilla TaxID=7936 RepID=A0A0E9S9S0_ANGAN